MSAGSEGRSDAAAVIEAVLTAAGLDGQERQDVERDLLNHFADGREAGWSEEELVARFGDPAEVGRSIRHALMSEGAEDAVARSLPDLRGRRPGASEVLAAAMSELGYAVRALRRAPAFAGLVVLTLALGMGANTAVFSVLDALLLRPLPYEDAGELVRVEELWGSSPLDASEYVRAPTVWAMREWTDIFESVGTMYTYRETGADLTGGDRPERVVATRVSAGFFETLGAVPVRGRTFSEEESYGPGEYGTEGRARVAVLSHGLWSRRFGRDPSLVGQSIDLDGVAVQVIGVMGPDFVDPLGSPSDLWLPADLRRGGSNAWDNWYLTVVARLAEGVDVPAAEARLGTRVAQLKQAEPDSGDEWGAMLTPLQSDIVGQTRRTMLWLLAAAVGLVLLSACVNAGNLVFARSLDREREVAVRGALGSTTGRLLRLVLLESLLLALGGAVAGIALGVLGVRVLLAAAPDALPTLVEPGLSPTVFGLAFVAMVISLVVFGMAPALRLSRIQPATALRAGGRSGTESAALKRVRAGMVVAQVSMALVLMVGAGLLVRSFDALRSVEYGTEPDNVLTFEVHLPLSRYADGPARQAFHDEFQARVAALPGVHSVGATSWLPLNGRYHIWGSVRPLGWGPEEPQGGGADVRMVQGDYFQAMGIQLLRGDPIADVDAQGGDVVWLSESVVRTSFPDTDPVGRRVGAVNRERTVVGVVEDVAIDSRGRVVPTVYVPHAQYADNRNWALIQAVRSEAQPEVLADAIEAELRRIDGGLVMYRTRELSTFVDRARAQDRFALILMATFALLATVLAGVGTYGLLAGSVARRTREIGIRMALGADASEVRWSVMRAALRMVMLGLVPGMLLAWMGTRWLQSLLFRIEPTDPVTYAGAALLLTLLAITASLLPAVRATRVNPARSLASE